MPSVAHGQPITAGSWLSRDMPFLPSNLKAIRSAAASLLRSNDHVGKLYATSLVASILNISIGADNDPTIDGIDSSLLCRAFTKDGATEYELSYSDHLGYEDDDHVLAYRSFNPKEAGQSRYIAIGCFSSAKQCQDVTISPFNCGLDQIEIFEVMKFLRSDKKKRESWK